MHHLSAPTLRYACSLSRFAGVPCWCLFACLNLLITLHSRCFQLVLLYCSGLLLFVNLVDLSRANFVVYSELLLTRTSSLRFNRFFVVHLWSCFFYGLPCFGCTFTKSIVSFCRIIFRATMLHDLFDLRVQVSYCVLLYLAIGLRSRRLYFRLSDVLVMRSHFRCRQ